VYDIWASVPWVHRVVLHREGSGNREDGAMREGGVEMNDTEQGRVRGRHPNTAKCTERCWDGAQDGLLGATNHPPYIPISSGSSATVLDPPESGTNKSVGICFPCH
jgi:hypothetical protein